MTIESYRVFAPKKPPEGHACNGCGDCCLAARCMLSEQTFGASDTEVCPALEWDGQKYRCGMTLHPSKYTGDDPSTDGYMVKLWAQYLVIDTHCQFDDETIMDVLSERLFWKDIKANSLPGSS